MAGKTKGPRDDSRSPWLGRGLRLYCDYGILPARGQWRGWGRIEEVSGCEKESEAPAMESLVRVGLHPWLGAYSVAVQHQGRLAADGMVAVGGIFEGMGIQVAWTMDGVGKAGREGGNRRRCQQEGHQHEQDEGLFCHRELLEMRSVNQDDFRR